MINENSYISIDIITVEKTGQKLILEHSVDIYCGINHQFRNQLKTLKKGLI